MRTERTFKPILRQITSGKLELHEPNSTSPLVRVHEFNGTRFTAGELVMATSRVQWNAALYNSLGIRLVILVLVLVLGIEPSQIDYNSFHPDTSALYFNDTCSSHYS